MDKNYIIKVAKLARLKIEEEEIDQYIFELEQIIKLTDKLQEVNIPHTTEIYNFTGRDLLLREDNKTEENCVEEILSNAPLARSNCFIVPKMVEYDN